MYRSDRKKQGIKCTGATGRNNSIENARKQPRRNNSMENEQEQLVRINGITCTVTVGEK